MHERYKTTAKKCQYFTDCVLASVDNHAMSRSRQKKTYVLHLHMAQQLVDSFSHLGIDTEGRSKKVAENFHGSVIDYARDIETRFDVKPFATLPKPCGKPFKSPLTLLKAIEVYTKQCVILTKKKSEKARQERILIKVRLAIAEVRITDRETT